MECIKCQGAVSGYKCDSCGEEMAEHDAGHGCGGERCVPKCASCNQAQTNCSCGSSGESDQE